jgi:hypothetical protein
LETILTKTIQIHHKDWAKRLPEALWYYRTTWCNTTRFKPYDIVYGKHDVFPIEFEVKNLRIALQANMDLTKAHKQHLNQINEIEEFCQSSIQKNDIIK